MTPEQGSPAAGNPPAARATVAVAATVISAAVIAPVFILAGHHHRYATLIVTVFFASATAAAWFGIVVDQPGTASLGGALAAGWTCCVLYAATRSLTVMNTAGLGLELGCVAAARPGMAAVRRRMPARHADGPGTVLLAGALIPFVVVWSLRALPRVAGAATVALLAGLARHPWTGALAAGFIAVFFWAGFTARLILLAGCAAGGVVSLTARACRRPLDRWRERHRQSGTG